MIFWLKIVCLELEAVFACAELAGEQAASVTPVKEGLIKETNVFHNDPF